MEIDGKNYQVQKAAHEIKLSELSTDKQEKMKKFFNIFDKEGGKPDGKLSKAEISDALKIVQNWEQGKKADGELTEKEIKKAIKKYPELKGLKKKEVKEFIKTFLSVNEQKVLAQEVQDAIDAAEAQKAKFVKEAQEARKAKEAQKAEEARKAAEAAEAAKAAEAEPKTYDYVVPEGQSFKALLKKILIAQGKEADKLTDEDYKQAEEQFIADNPDTKIRGNKVKYLLAGEKVKVSADFGEELLDSEAEAAKWAKKVAANKQANEKPAAEKAPTEKIAAEKEPEQVAPAGKAAAEKEPEEKSNAPDPKLVEEAKEKGMRPTDNKNFFYNETEKMHYRYKDGKFIKYDNIKLLRQDGTYIREYKNKDGSAKVIDYSKDGYPTSMQGRNYQGKTYMNEKKQAQVLGLNDTFATNNKHIYYDPKTKMHFQWNDEKKNFAALDKDVRYVSPDAVNSYTPSQVVTARNRKTGELKTITEKYPPETYDGQSYTFDKHGQMIKSETKDGTSYNYTLDSKGNRINTVVKKNGMVDGVYNHSYDNHGNRTHTTHRDATGRVVSTGEFKYNEANERIYESYKDVAGKQLKSMEWHKDEDGKWHATYKDGTGKVISEEEYNAIEV